MRKIVISKTYRNYLVSMVVLVAATSLSYYAFQTFRPIDIKAVKEDQPENAFGNSLMKLPQMNGSTVVGSSSSSKGDQITLEIKRSPNEVRNFYKNVFIDQGWVLGDNTETPKTYLDLYKMEGKIAEVTISKEDQIVTVVGITLKTN